MDHQKKIRLHKKVKSQEQMITKVMERESRNRVPAINKSKGISAERAIGISKREQTAKRPISIMILQKKQTQMVLNNRITKRVIPPKKTSPKKDLIKKKASKMGKKAGAINNKNPSSSKRPTQEDKKLTEKMKTELTSMITKMRGARVSN